MKRFSGLGSGMSSYQYSAKKTVWKWTPAKIAAFSMFGIMMAALIYFESTSSRTSYEPVLVQEQRNAETPITDFEKEYQEFLKRGTKIVSQEALDSLNAIESTDADQAQVEQSPSTRVEELTPPVQAKNRTTPRQSPPASKSPVDSQSDQVPENIENKLQTVEDISTPKSEKKEDLIGVLEEVSPEEYNAILNKSRIQKEEQGKAIIEEFYVEETINGRIYAISDGSPMAGVSITVKGTNVSTVSDSSGRYTITVPGDPEHRTIRYSYQDSFTERDVDPGTSVLNIRF
jgi:hypothetical protein